MSNADDSSKYFFEKNEKCCYFQSFNYPEDLFTAFSSILFRIYLHLCLEFIYRVYFFYEFFDILEKYKLSFCLKNSVKKLQFGPYYSHAFDITLTTINL